MVKIYIVPVFTGLGKIIVCFSQKSFNRQTESRLSLAVPEYSVLDNSEPKLTPEPDFELPASDEIRQTRYLPELPQAGCGTRPDILCGVLRARMLGQNFPLDPEYTGFYFCLPLLSFGIALYWFLSAWRQRSRHVQCSQNRDLASSVFTQVLTSKRGLDFDILFLRGAFRARRPGKISQQTPLINKEVWQTDYLQTSPEFICSERIP